jgi:hypothetical protein
MPYEQLSWNPGSDPKEPTPIARSTHNSRTQESRNLISDPNYLAVLKRLTRTAGSADPEISAEHGIPRDAPKHANAPW